MPFKFKIVEKSLFVHVVPAKQYKDLLGAELISVEGIKIDELLERQSHLRGTENDYTKFAVMLYRSFSSIDGLANLIPEWNASKPITMIFKNNNGRNESVKIEIPFEIKEPQSVQSKVEMPSTVNSDFYYNFLDEKKQTALLIIKDMSAYREGFENLKAKGYNGIEEIAKAAYKRFQNSNPPEEWNKIMEGIPSATETFVKLIKEMKEAGTTNLIIDLRENTGGNSIMREILVYLLY